MPDLTPQLTVRNLDRETYDQFRRGAAARGITQAEYLRRLVELHASCRNGDPYTGDRRSLLADAGLDTITA